jgi:2-oxoisovalerate dehydrogenase E1 component alpha subunit
MSKFTDIASVRRTAPERGKASRSVARFEVRFTRYLDQDGTPVAELPAFARDAARLVPMYRHMVLTRLFDEKAVALQRTGQLGTYPSSSGQEASAVGIGTTMARDDVLLSSYRETGTMLVRGVRMSDILLYWGGDERGMAYTHPGEPRQDFPIFVPIASQAPQAVGVAYALKLRREPRVAVCVLGDGGSSKGDFYEAMNAAGVWQLPVVFVIVNNGWAISVPRETQSHAQTLAQKAIAAGIEGEQVDGNDLIAVHDVLERALGKARRGGGPHVVEALTYRMHDHTTADDARRYRSADELESRRALDPIERVRKHLVSAGAWTEPDEELLRADLGAQIEQAVKEYLATEAPAPESMFDHLFAQLPSALEPQRDELAAEGDACKS